MKNKSTVVLAFWLLAITCSLSASAQPGGPDTPAPLGFTEVLIGAGALLGTKKLLKKKTTEAGE